MSRRIPRLEVIEAFVEAARAPSFRIAEDRCALSPAAFSRRIQAFTAFVGHEVFVRHPGGMRLTDAGRACLDTLEPTYRAILGAARDLEAKPAAQKISISLSHSLAVGWLIPRIERFYALHPHIEVAIVTTRTAEAIRAGVADLGLCAGDVDVADLHAETLLQGCITPVASPAVARRLREGTRRLADERLLTFAQHQDMWAWWSHEAGVDCGLPREASTFDMAQALYEAAAAGLGIAPGIDVIMAGHLSSGRLVELGLPAVRYPGAYRLVAKPSRLRSNQVAPLWAWLKDEAARDRRPQAPVRAVA